MLLTRLSIEFLAILFSTTQNCTNVIFSAIIKANVSKIAKEKYLFIF